MVKVKRFTAKWCGPCHQLAPVFEQMATEFPNVQFETIDVDTSPDYVQEYMVTSVPTVVIEHEGQAVQRYVGLNPKSTYSNFIKSLI
jgi:thioredoxin 1